MSKTPLKNFVWMDLFTKHSDSEASISKILKNNQLFFKLTRRELNYISKMVHIRNYDPDELIFSQGEKGLGMYILVKGMVEITRNAPEKADQEYSVTTLGPGSFFGELALCSRDSKRTGSAFARGPTTLIGFFKPDLIDIMERKPEMGVKILYQLSRVISRRLIETNAAFAQSVLETQVEHRKQNEQAQIFEMEEKKKSA